MCFCVHNRDKITSESSHWLRLLSGGWGMPSLPLAYWSGGQLRLWESSWLSNSAAHKPSDFSFLPRSVKAAHSPNPVWAIRSVGAGQPGNPELQLILELTGGRMSAAAAGNKVVIQLVERSWAVDLSAREPECVDGEMCCVFTWWGRALAPWGITAKRRCKCHVQYTVLVWSKAEKMKHTVL